MKNSSRLPQPRISARLLRIFAGYSRHYVRRHFHAVRILKNKMPFDCAQPLVIYLNHAAWWDPLVSLLLAREFFPQRNSYAPIDATMIERYSFFRRLGFFGVEQNTAAGARDFLRTTQAILASSGNALWLTPQGRFTDVRARPLRLQSGLNALTKRVPNAAVIPLAIEYSFWTEPRPEILVAFGQPILLSDANDRLEILSDALENLQDELAEQSCRRDAGAWLTLNRGKSGVHAIYDAWRRLKSQLRGEKFAPEHHAEAQS
ncbi:MAG: lysophospholipid acyltransferase family protein [Verrucomicrobiota bacterium]|nr:lysophospholipid acyltransferase family protein [Verrucomicrobiota bacterium]